MVFPEMKNPFERTYIYADWPTFHRGIWVEPDKPAFSPPILAASIEPPPGPWENFFANF